MKKIITLFVIILCVIQNTFGQIQDIAEKDNRFKHGIGAGAGATTGIGIIYKYSPKKFGVQFAFAPLLIDKNEVNLSLGCTFSLKLAEPESINFFIYEGNHLLYIDEDYSLNHGIGFGVEFITFERVGLNFMAGYGSYDNFDFITFTAEATVLFHF